MTSIRKAKKKYKKKLSQGKAFKMRPMTEAELVERKLLRLNKK